MTQQETFIAAIKAADITQDDWQWRPFEAITDRYAKGYLEAHWERLSANWEGEELRNEILDIASWRIWDK